MSKTQNPTNPPELTNKISDIWSEQAEFQHHFVDLENMTPEERVRFTKENMLALHRELGELLNELPWKPHRAKNQEYNIDNIQEEMIDCFKYMINLALTWGLTPEKFEELFMKKSQIVKQRYEQEKDRIN